VEPILAFPPPADVKSLQRFLGMVNFYRRFLPGIAHVLAPLTSATKGKGRLTWTPEMTLSFQNAKSSLATAVPLKHPDPTAPLSLATDASNSHVGAVLQQKTNGSWQPLSFFSKKLSARETRYSWPPSFPSNISDFSSKVVLSPFSQTTNPFWPPSANNPPLFPHASKGTFLSFPNSMHPFSICPATKMW
jgi:hypothetical protein